MNASTSTGASTPSDATLLPRQGLAGAPPAHPVFGGEPDPLDQPDPLAAADAAATENLLRCWVRERSPATPDDQVLTVRLDSSGVRLRVPVRYWSATGWHRFGRPEMLADGQDPLPVDAVTLAALLSREALREPSEPPPAPVPDPSADERSRAGHPPAEPVRRAGDARPTTVEATGDGRTTTPDGCPEATAALVGRVADSLHRTAVILAERRAHPADRTDDEPFLVAEQSLVLGHPLHPTPKSREGLSDAEARRYAPELRGSFALHWLAVDSSVLAADSAWTDRGRVVPPERLARMFADPELPLPPGTHPLPVHPWQAGAMWGKSEVRALLEAGLLHDLGPSGQPWHPTSSVRTVYQPGAVAMLKLSLGLSITNSRRENLRKELLRGAEVHRLLRTGLAAEWSAAHPGFGIVRDPAWLAVNTPDGTPVRGLDVVVRHCPFRPTDDVGCVAGLTAQRPWPGATAMTSRLALLVAALSSGSRRAAHEVSVEWFLRYLAAVVRPVLWLDGQAGVALEAHQQNTLVVLDREGWPVGGRYRDNQGYYFRSSRRDDLERRLAGVGRHSDTFVADEVVDERFAYYLAVNNVFGLIGAFGAQRLADERTLLAAFRDFLREAATGPDRSRSPLPTLLLDSPTLRCKANLLTRVHGMDELVGPVDTQSVYATMRNPLYDAG